MEEQIRFSIPSKGRLSEDCLAFLDACGLAVYRPNIRAYVAQIPGMDGMEVLFQRASDIVVSVRDGSVDFGITGMDVIAEKRGDNGDVLVLHDALGFGGCRLGLAVPESWQGVNTMQALKEYAAALPHPLRIATKYPALVSRFLAQWQIEAQLISAEGTLEIAPSIGYADMIADIISSGQTLQDNRLRQLADGIIMTSEASLIANTSALKQKPRALELARIFIEYFEAHIRAQGQLSIFANMRGSSADEVAQRIFAACGIRGLQGPTISPILMAQENPGWFDANLIVPRKRLFQTIQELRAAGGSGVAVLPVAYIFEEEPARYRAMLEAIQSSKG